MAPIRSRRQLLRLLLGSSFALLPWRARAAAQAAPLRLLAVGDGGSGDQQQQAVADQMAAWHRRQPLDLVLLAGDTLYGHDGVADGSGSLLERCFHRPYRALLQAGVPFHAVLGNHDIVTANGRAVLTQPALGMAGRWYSLRRGATELFLLDTNPSAPWQHQLPWLRRALAASSATWKLVMGHHPLYSAGVYGDDPALIARLEPVFRRHGVQLYIHGHDHNYERTRPIAGITHLGVGGGGAHLRPVLATAHTARTLSRHSFAVLEIRRDQLLITAVDAQGATIDQARLNARGQLLS